MKPWPASTSTATKPIAWATPIGRRLAIRNWVAKTAPRNGMTSPWATATVKLAATARAIRSPCRRAGATS